MSCWLPQSCYESELINAGLALISGVGLLRLRSWSIATSLFTAGMWAYGVSGGIGLVLEHGLDFSSPFGALTDAVLFPLILVFSVYMSIVIWRNRARFLSTRATSRSSAALQG